MTHQPISGALSQELVLRCPDAWGDSHELPASFAYDRSDPWAVRMTFRAPDEAVCWLVGRDLLLQGLTDPAGEGDVRLSPSIDDDGRAVVVMELCSPDGRLATQLLTNELYRFLTRTLAAVPLGTESIDLDQLVDALTGRSQPQ